MLSHRVIPCLLLSNGELVKTLKFSSPKYVGDPINAVKIFNEKEVDELMVLDIDASKMGRGPDFALIEQLAGECFMPLCYGGGIRNLDDAKTLFSLGVEKITMQSTAAGQPNIVRAMSDRFGEQAVVVSVDVRRDWLGRPKLFRSSAIASPYSDWRDALRAAVHMGAGEVLFNVVNRDGTLSGMDLDLIRQASTLIDVPLIAIGGAASLDDIKAAVDAGASAVGAGAFFVFHGPHRAVLITYPRYEELQMLWRN